MKHFYAGTFMNQEDLRGIGIEYPVKLDYYKIKHSNINEVYDEYEIKFGIEVVKTSYINEKIKIENAEISELTEDENIVNNILDLLKKNQVTPVSAQYVVEDLLKEL